MENKSSNSINLIVGSIEVQMKDTPPIKSSKYRITDNGVWLIPDETTEVIIDIVESQMLKNRLYFVPFEYIIFLSTEVNVSDTKKEAEEKNDKKTSDDKPPMG